jgi:LIVCS family branched-chain amino acid:cation transporter
MYLGATARSLFPAGIERTELLINIAFQILGNTGKVALGLAVSLACLTTSIGLTATVGDYFSSITKGKLKYKMICVATVLFSGVFATVGVNKIVQIAVPFLVMVYPVAIILILLTIFGGKKIHRKVYTGAVVGALTISVFDALTSAGLPIALAHDLISYIPLAKDGFPWIIPALIGGLVGVMLAYGPNKNSE